VLRLRQVSPRTRWNAALLDLAEGVAKPLPTRITVRGLRRCRLKIMEAGLSGQSAPGRADGTVVATIQFAPRIFLSTR
jgi:hypothetical protein